MEESPPCREREWSQSRLRKDWPASANAFLNLFDDHLTQEPRQRRPNNRSRSTLVRLPSKTSCNHLSYLERRSRTQFLFSDFPASPASLSRDSEALMARSLSQPVHLLTRSEDLEPATTAVTSECHRRSPRPSRPLFLAILDRAKASLGTGTSLSSAT